MSPEQISADAILSRVIRSSIDSVKPNSLFRGKIIPGVDRLSMFGSDIPLRSDSRILCISFGKCAEAMASEVCEVLGDRVEGIIASPIPSALKLTRFKYFLTGHPYPDHESAHAGESIRRAVVSSSEDDVIVFLISGGGSASIFVPVEGVSLADAVDATRIMMERGVPISKTNLIRKHISSLGGGKLAAIAPHSQKVSLILSDVVGNDPLSIASGPTVSDSSTSREAIDYLKSSGLVSEFPTSIVNYLDAHVDDKIVLDPAKNVVHIVGTNRIALEAAKQGAIDSGVNAVVVSDNVQGDASDVARMLVVGARTLEDDNEPVSTPALLLYGGESTVCAIGGARGGRNQHVVLCAIQEMRESSEPAVGFDRTTIFSFGTDGKDGNSSAAGASASFKRFRNADPEEIRITVGNFESASFFEKHGGTIVTGRTDTNVMDIFGVIVV